MTFARVALAIGVLAACKSEPRSTVDRAPRETPASTRSGDSPRASLVDEEHLAALIAQPPKPQWFGVSLSGKKIGHASLSLRREGAEIIVSSSLSVSRDSTGVALELSEERRYSSRAPHELASISSSESSADSVVEWTAIRRGGGMERRRRVDGVQVESGGIATSRETLADSVSQSFARPAWLEVGRVATLRELDIEAGLDRESRAHVSGKRDSRVAGVDGEIAEIELSRPGEVTTRTTLGGSGLVLSAQVGAFALVAQDERSAKSDIVGLDLAASPIRINRPLGRLSSLESLELELRIDSSIAEDALIIPSAPNQVVSGTADRARLRLSAGRGDVLGAAERAAALRPTPAFDFEDARIMELAARLVAGAPSRRAAIEALSTHVYQTIEKSLATDLSSASQVLERGVGDCTEHALLFVALARAAGIPSREVSGLIYLGDEIGAFGWHAWAEVELDGRWFRVDPSWGEVPASAAHITLGIDDDSGWIALIGALEIEILSVNGS